MKLAALTNHNGTKTFKHYHYITLKAPKQGKKHRCWALNHSGFMFSPLRRRCMQEQWSSCWSLWLRWTSWSCRRRYPERRRQRCQTRWRERRRRQQSPAEMRFDRFILYLRMIRLCLWSGYVFSFCTISYLRSFFTIKTNICVFPLWSTSLTIIKHAVCVAFIAHLMPSGPISA